MRCLALARYRLLTTIRAGGWIFGLSIATAMLPAIVSGFWSAFMRSSAYAAGIFTRHSLFPQVADQVMPLAARIVVIVYLLHAVVLIAACHVFAPTRRHDEAGASDLMDTVPLPPTARYWGDALGTFASVMTLHVCTAPFLALIVMLSPFPARLFVYLELAILALVVLDSAGAAWKAGVVGARWNTRAFRSAATFIGLLSVAVAAGTRWESFRDGLAAFLVWPSLRSWAALVSAVDNPPLLISMVVVLYLSFIAFFHLHAAGSLERR